MSKNIGRRASAQDNFTGPNAPTNLSATNVGSGRAFNDGRIDLSWTAPVGENTPTGYKIIRGANELATVAHPTTTYSNTGLSSDASYSYTVVAYDSYGSSPASNSASATATTVPATALASRRPSLGNTWNSLFSRMRLRVSSFCDSRG